MDLEEAFVFQFIWGLVLSEPVNDTNHVSDILYISQFYTWDGLCRNDCIITGQVESTRW